ncbi:MAG: hypothetical protein WC714_20625 [Candidatus Obscuribacterales bacterium]|jgi:hypothetical protein
MSTQSASRLGNLLQEFGVLSPESCSKTEELSTFSGLPFGKCLILLDLISDDDLKEVLDGQSLLREGIFTKPVVAQAIREVCKEHISISEALGKLGEKSKATKRTRLGELLNDAQAISPKQLEVALKVADFASLPLGHILTSFDTLEPALVDQAIEIQRKIRKGELERGAGVELIRQTNQDLSSKISAGSGHFALGEILRFAKLLTSQQIDEAVAAASAKKQLLGEYLVEMQLVSDETMTAALCVQSLIASHLLSIDSGCEVIGSVARFKTSTAQDFDGITFQDFLKISGYLTNSKLRVVMTKLSSDPSQTFDAFKQSLQDTSRLRELLTECFADDVSLINAGAVLFQLVQLKKLNLNQALLTFAFRKNGVSLATVA